MITILLAIAACDAPRAACDPIRHDLANASMTIDRPQMPALAPEDDARAGVKRESTVGEAILAPRPGADDDPVLSSIFAEVVARGGRVTPLYRTLALSPTLLRAWKTFSWELRDGASAPRSVRELMILRILQLAQAKAEFAIHEGLGLKAGLSPNQIEHLAHWHRSDDYTPPDKAALAVAEQIFAGPASRPAMLELKRHFSDREVMELTMTASFYVMLVRFTQSLRL
ncbi:MAG: carboxymuconolactone decarboxylase family protein [Sphingobium sp.]